MKNSILVGLHKIKDSNLPWWDKEFKNIHHLYIQMNRIIELMWLIRLVLVVVNNNTLHQMED